MTLEEISKRLLCGCAGCNKKTITRSTVLALLDRLEIAIDELKRQWACEPHRNGDECGHADTAKKALTALREPLK